MKHQHLIWVLLFFFCSSSSSLSYALLVEGSQEMAAMCGAVPGIEQREESYNPLATPDVDKLNATYLSVHGSAIWI